MAAAGTLLATVRAYVIAPAVAYARTHLRTVVASALMLVMPFLLVGSCNTMTIADLGTMVPGAMLRDNPVLAHMLKKEEGRYARTLADLVENNPQTFLKFVDQDVELLLQKPGLKRADGPMQVWQYRNDICVLDLYIGTDEASGKSRVLDYEVRERIKARMGADHKPVGDDALDADCLRSVIATRGLEQLVKLAGL